MSDKEYVCNECSPPKVYANGSGLWKHKKAKHGDADTQVKGGNSSPNVHSRTLASNLDEGTDLPSPPVLETDITTDETESIWNKWETTIVDESTESVPSGLKMIAAGGKVLSGAKLSKAQRKALDEKSIALLTLGLTGADGLITFYGQKTTLSDDYSCRHSSGEKRIVAEAQLEAFKSKGIEITSVLSPTTIAVALTAGYIIPPIVKLQKNKKRKLLMGGGRKLLSYIPIFGRRWRTTKEESTFFNEEDELI